MTSMRGGHAPGCRNIAINPEEQPMWNCAPGCPLETPLEQQLRFDAGKRAIETRIAHVSAGYPSPPSLMTEAWDAGYAAGEKGDPANFNPHPDTAEPMGLEKHWRDGWEAAKDDAATRREKVRKAQERAKLGPAAVDVNLGLNLAAGGDRLEPGKLVFRSDRACNEHRSYQNGCPDCEIDFVRAHVDV